MTQPSLMRSRVILATTIVLLGLACSSPSTPTGVSGQLPSTSVPQPPNFEMVPVNVEGRVIDVDTDRPVPNAVVTPTAVCAPGMLSLCEDLKPAAGPSATSGANGGFALVATLPKTWTVLHFRITRDGFEPVHDLVHPSQVTAAQLWVLPTLTIRPGESLAISRFLGGSTCTWDDFPCRRVLVSASQEERVEVEVIGVDGENVGIFSSAGGFASSQRQVTVSGGEVWVYAGTPAATAFRPVFEQSLTVRARRH